MFVAGFAFTPRLIFPGGSLGKARRVSRIPVRGRIQRNDEVAVNRGLLLRSKSRRLGRPVVLVFREYPETGLGQMAGHSDDGPAKPFCWKQTCEQSLHMSIAWAGVMKGTDGGFDEGPLEKWVDLAFWGAAVVDAISGRDEPGHQASVARQTFRAGEARHIADLESNHRAERIGNARQSHQPAHGGSGSDFGTDTLLERLDFDLELIESVELHHEHAGRDRRQFGET